MLVDSQAATMLVLNSHVTHKPSIYLVVELYHNLYKNQGCTVLLAALLQHSGNLVTHCHHTVTYTREYEIKLSNTHLENCFNAIYIYIYIYIFVLKATKHESSWEYLLLEL